MGISLVGNQMGLPLVISPLVCLLVFIYDFIGFKRLLGHNYYVLTFSSITTVNTRTTIHGNISPRKSNASMFSTPLIYHFNWF